MAASLNSLVGRDPELRRLKDAIRKRESRLIWGPADAGKSFLVKAAIEGLTEPQRKSCICWSGAATGRQLITHFLRCLYRIGDPFVRKKVHADGARGDSLNSWLGEQSTPRLRGILLTAAENGEYRFFLDQLPPFAHRMARLMKEFTNRCKTPVYLVGNGYTQGEIGYAWSLYWTDEYRIRLGPLTEGAARDLVEMCIHRFGMAELELDGFREEILHLSDRLPGAIVKMCELAADPRYHYGDQIKTKLVHVDYLMKVSPGAFMHPLSSLQ
ncbi:MAG: ATP-binding protein [Candidatus Acidiferrales bacterium]